MWWLFPDVAELSRLLTPVAMLMLIGLPRPGYGEAWLLQPAAQLIAGADDNLRLSHQGEEAVGSGSVTAGLAAHRVTEVLDVRAAASVGYTSYAGDDRPEDEDVEVLQLDSVWSRERGALSLGGEFRRDTTLTEIALPQGESDLAGDLDVGLVEESIRRHRVLLDGSFEHALSERLDARVGYDVTRLDYREGEELGLHDSWTHRFDVRTLYRALERTRVGFGVQALVFRSAVSAEDLDSVSLISSLDHRLSELSSVSIVGGVWKAEGQQQGGADEDQTGFMAQLTGRTRGERWSGSLSAEHALRPSGEGVLREADQIIIRAALDLSPRLGLEFSGRAFETRALIAASDLPVRRYAEAEPSIVWRLAPAWSLAALYRYRWADTEDEPDSASSNSVAVLLEYRPPMEVGGR